MRVYLWPGEDRQTIIEPEWVNNYGDAEALAASVPERIKQTRFIMVEIKSKYPQSHPLFGRSGTWSHVKDEDQQSPRVYYTSGWANPNTWGIDLENNKTWVDKIDDDIWQDEWSYTELSDSDLSLDPEFDEEGNPVNHTIYRIDSYVFAGINVGDDHLVANPHNFGSHNNLPAPIDFVHEHMPISDETRRAHLLVIVAVLIIGYNVLLVPAYNYSQASQHPFETIFSGGENLARGYTFTPPLTGFEITVYIALGLGIVLILLD